MANTKLRRISGNIFSHELHDTLNLDGLILQVRYGFNPIDAAWRDYTLHVNPRIDANTMVYDYNRAGRMVPTREEFPEVIYKELEIMASRGCRRIATNPLWFREEGENVRKGGMEADKMMDDAINAWLKAGDNSLRVDVIYVVDKYAKNVPSFREIARDLNPKSFTGYLNRGFRRDVSAWFDTTRMGNRYFCASVALITSDGNGLNNTGHDASLRFKVASMYACVLTHASVAVTKERDAFYAMSKVLRFPLIDRFMAGYVHPMTALKVSNLLPTDKEKDLFFDLVHAVWDEVRGYIDSICEIREPRTRAEDYILYTVAPVKEELLRRTESYLDGVERYLKGESEYCPTDLFPSEWWRD